MRTKDGKRIISCSMVDDVEKNGPCATCMYHCEYVNTPSMKPGDESYCCDHRAVTEEI